MTEHPLTDEKALDLFSFERLMDDSRPITVEDSMRTAADWQLEQCLEFLQTHPFHERDDYKYLGAHDYAQLMEEAMRPTTKENS